MLKMYVGRFIDEHWKLHCKQTNPGVSFVKCPRHQNQKLGMETLLQKEKKYIAMVANVAAFGLRGSSQR